MSRDLIKDSLEFNVFNDSITLVFAFIRFCIVLFGLFLMDEKISKKKGFRNSKRV